MLPLRRLGLRLDEIERATQTDAGDLLPLVERQLARVDAEIGLAEAMRSRLAGLAETLRSRRDPSHAAILDVLEAMAMTNR